MGNDMIDDLERRLRAARPPVDGVDDDAFDAELLARVQTGPIASPRHVSRTIAIPVAAGLTLTGAAVVMLAGGPGDVGGPSSAAAITQTLRWLDPPSHSVLHVRSTETQDGLTTTRESWVSSDHPASERMRVEGQHVYETSGEAFYDPATNTIYDAPAKPDGAGNAKTTVKKVAVPGSPAAGKDGAALPAGDPVVDKVRILLQEGAMEVTGRENHNGTEAWAISLKPDVGRPVWTLWVSATNGKPLELRDPGRDASEKPQVIRWPTYEVLPDSGENSLVTLTGAHPSARVVDDPEQVAAAAGRLMPGKP